MFNQKTLTTTALVWIPLAIVLTAAIGFAYIGTQQVYRTALNDPQIEVAAQAVEMVAAGQDVTALVPTEKTNLATSPSTFIIFYDRNGKLVAGSGTLNGTVPTPPAGVLDYAKTHGENRLTWQPKPGVRIATVVRKTSDGYVLVGRSMREVETRIGDLADMASIAWLLGLSLSLAVTLIIAHARENKKN